MNEKAFGKIEYCLECLIEAAAQLNSQEAGRDIAAARTELANARKLVEAAEIELEKQACICKLLPLVGGSTPCGTCELRSLVAACRCGEKPECLS